MNDHYLAFFVAMTDNQLFTDTFKQFCTGKHTIAFETSPTSHKETEGKHIHVLAEMSDKQYRALILKLKYLKVPLNGRSCGEQTRSYGKVKLIKDPLKMLAYTIKGNNFITTEPSDLIQKAQEISYEKENPLTTLRSQINAHLDLTVLPNLSITDDTNLVYVNDTGSQYSVLGLFKLTIINYFRNNGEKMPSKTKLLYFIQHYCMYHSSLFSDSQILDLFY